MKKKYILSLLIIIGLSVIPKIAYADSLGDREIFYVNTGFDAYSRLKVSATLKNIGDHAYMYIEDDFWNDLTTGQQTAVLINVKSLTNEFDNHIFPVLTNFYGPIPDPGIDNDSKITFLLSELIPNIGGYFDTVNQSTKKQSRISNEREMIVISAADIGDLPRMQAFVGHELQHLISYKHKEIDYGVVDDIWINEARSEYALTRLGYNEPFRNSHLERRAIALIQSPTDSLTEWKNLFADYGQVTIFGEYIADTYSPQVIADTLDTSKVGISELNYALKKNGFADQFETIFGDWMVANYINNPSLNNRYGYERSGLVDLRVAPTVKFSGFDEDKTLEYSYNFKDWEPRWYDFSSFTLGDKDHSTLAIDFTSTSLASFRVAYILYNKDGSVIVNNVRLSNQESTVYINNIYDDVQRVVIMPYKTDKISGFVYEENTVPLSLILFRTELNNENEVELSRIPTVVPATFDLKEGDFIRAFGDDDIYIINYAGYKRLVLNPEICLQYGHLGERGCFDAVNLVTPEVRDAFITSNVYTNGETKDGILFQMNITGSDTATLTIINKEKFISDGNTFSSVFQFNSLEQNSYSR
ncbi:MAG: hypothetical protein Q7R95_07210 [bacterium]|nr:hypothetical protein [bacterium]